MERFGIFKSPRIRGPTYFMSDLRISEQKEFTFFILLGTESAFQQIKSATGYTRVFNSSILPPSNAFDSNIPERETKMFGPLVPANIHVRHIKPDESIHGIKDRVLATAGFKTFSEIYTDHKDPIHHQIVEELHTLQYELTAFTGFIRGIGVTFLEYIIDNFFIRDGSTWAGGKRPHRYILHSVVVKEHGLVDYYTKKCKFQLSGRPDVAISPSEKLNDFSEDMVVARKFHISFLQRVILAE